MSSIPTDNAVIDYNALSNIYNTLSVHADIFTAFENQALITYTDTTNNTSSINVTSSQIVTARMSGKSGQSNTIPFGVSFSSQPVVIVTVEVAGTSTAYIAQITSTSSASTTGSGTTYASADVFVYDPILHKTGVSVVINLIAIGQR
jgi:hypothetical protein